MKFRRMFIVAVALLTSLSGQDKPETTFKVDVKLVNVFVTVTDQQGAPIGNLGKNDFSLSEDGVPQKIAVFSKESQLPLSIVLAIDTSSSTRKDIRLELEAAQALRPPSAASDAGRAGVGDRTVPRPPVDGHVRGGIARSGRRAAAQPTHD